MGFLNAMLLFGTAAFAVPLGIHLLNRSRFYSVDWAAMHLLDVSDLQNARRIEWRSLLLLLLRCMIPIVLAVCMARPIVQTAAVGGASGRSTTVLLLDDSYSMQGVLQNLVDSSVAGPWPSRQPTKWSDSWHGRPNCRLSPSVVKPTQLVSRRVATHGRCSERFVDWSLCPQPLT